MKRPANRLRMFGVLLWGALAVPALRHALESTMMLQMLVQFPLLALAGWSIAREAPERLDRRLAPWDRGGVSGLLLASLTSMVWMLPRATDAVLDDPWVALAKFVSVPLMIGAAIALSWPRAGFVVRGVVLLELAATAFRLGWLYLISPVRLCSNYLLDDQQRLGTSLLAIGATIVLVLGWKLLWGRFDTAPAGREQPGTGGG